jgi:hypothetical protein
MGWLGPNPQPKGSLSKNRSEQQKKDSAEAQKKLDKAKKRAADDEKKLRDQLNSIIRKAGKGNLSRGEMKLLKDNGEMGALAKQKSYQKHKGVERW